MVPKDAADAIRARATHPQPNVQRVGERVGERVGDRMDCILAMYRPGAKITVLVRAPGYPDLVQTNDDLDEAIEVLRRRHQHRAGVVRRTRC